MRIIKPYLFVIVTFAAFTACGTDSSSDDIDAGEFVVSFEMLVPVSQQPNGTFNVTNGRFIAYFTERQNISQYELRVVQEDQTKGEPFIYHLQQLQGPPGENLRYFVVIGSSRTYSGVNEARKNEIVEEFQQELEESKHLYHLLEVKPLRE
ncbi:MAG: hypothetical protein EA359_06275 [Balneolaceae bacterium]|nr:MAG: hypothetical protein EA359_06275 [Balneolaceae bacterium]